MAVPDFLFAVLTRVEIATTKVFCINRKAEKGIESTFTHYVLPQLFEGCLLKCVDEEHGIRKIIVSISPEAHGVLRKTLPLP